VNDLPLFPLNAVLFPGGRLPLRIFEPRYMDMAKACLREGAPFGVCLLRSGAEVLQPGGAPAVPSDIGCLARIGQWDMAQLGVLQVVARGEARFRIVARRTQPDGLARADVEMIEADAECEIPPHCASCVRLLERLLVEAPGLVEAPHRLDSGSWVSARLAELLPLPLETKQQCLEMTQARERLERLNSLLAGARAAP
jgi:uncharacterized protein